MLFMGVSVPDAANVCNESKVESYDTDIKYCPEFYAENEKENTTESDSDINSDIFEDDSVIGSLNEITKDKSDVTFYDIYESLKSGDVDSTIDIALKVFSDSVIYEDQDTQQDDNGHLADGADIGQTTADAVLVDGQFVLGLLHAVAGCIDSAGKPFILAKEAKHIVTCQQILDFTDAVSLAGGTGCANGSQPLAEQTRNEDHNQCDDQRNHQKQPMNGCQCNDAEHHLCRRTHDGEKRSPGHLLNLVHVVGKLGEVLAALLLMILLMGLVQQARCHIPAQSVVHPAHGPALEEGLCNQAKDHGQPGQQKKNDPNGESPQITVQQSLGDLNLYQTGADLQTIGNNHTDGGRCNSGPALFEIILHDFHLFCDRSICLYEQWIVCFALSDSNCSTQDEE